MDGLLGVLPALRAKLDEKMKDEKAQRKLVLVCVCIALLLDNMLYMVVVPILPDYLKLISNKSERVEKTITWDQCVDDSCNATTEETDTVWVKFYPIRSEDAIVGFLFSSKALVQLLVNPISGAIIDRMGYEKPMMFGLSIIFFATTLFAFGKSYAVMLIARSLQGVGSAFADTSGLAMIADRFTEEHERTTALGIALAFISFGCLVAPPFGGIMYEFLGMAAPFLGLSAITFLDGVLLMMITRSSRQRREEMKQDLPKGTPIYRLLMDPYILCCAGCLAMANVSLAFLEPTIAIWMEKTMNAKNWQMGLIWLPGFIPHITGVYLSVRLSNRYPKYQWLLAAAGLAIEGVSCIFVPFCSQFWTVAFWICCICFGIALVDTALLPLLAYLVDTRHTSVYGSVYAIADISYSMAYAFGPMTAGAIVAGIGDNGFLWLNMIIFLSNVLYAPIMATLRHLYRYDQFENKDPNVVVGEPPEQQYRTYMVNGSNGGGATEPLDYEASNVYGASGTAFDPFNRSAYQKVATQDSAADFAAAPSANNPFRIASGDPQSYSAAAPAAPATGQEYQSTIDAMKRTADSTQREAGASYRFMHDK